jgi:hypothetical protein
MQELWLFNHVGGVNNKNLELKDFFFMISDLSHVIIYMMVIGSLHDH